MPLDTPGDIVDPACPINWANPVNRGLLHEWAVSPNAGWRGGKTFRDLVRGGHTPDDGTLTNGPVWAGPPPGGYGSLSFDGTDDIVLLGTAFDLPNATTISALIRVTSTAVNNGIIAVNRWLLRVSSGGSLRWWPDVFFDAVDSTGVVTAGVWTTIAVTQDTAGAWAFYINGRAAGSGTGANPISNTPSFANNKQIGSYDPGTWQFGGQIAAVRVWNRALSGAEVAAVYAESLRGNPTRWRWVRPWSFGVTATGGGGGGTTPQSLAGSLTPTGTLRLQVAKALAGSATAAGSLTKAAAKPLAGSLTGVGALALQASKAFSGSVTATGAVAKQVGKPLAGSVTPAGTVSTLAVKVTSVGGSMQPSGTVANVVGKALTGSATATGTVAKTTAKPLAGSTTPAGSIAKSVSKPLAGSSTPTGTVSTLRAALVAIGGSVAAVGSLVKSVLKALAGFVTGSGVVTTSGGAVTHPPNRIEFPGPVCTRREFPGPVCTRKEF